ncbi:MAG: hypothetical protein Fur0025_40010 [Oscillatoriaceae cyanobacterium]
MKKLLDDIQNQLLDSLPIAIYIIDNASADDTDEIGMGLAAVDSRFHYARNATNIGGAANVAQAMRTGEGEYLWLLSDHMRLHEGAIERLLKYLETEQPDLVYCGIEQYGTPTIPDSSKPVLIANLSPSQLHEFLFCTSNLAGLLVKRDVVKASAERIEAYKSLSYPHLGVWEYLLAMPEVKLGILPNISHFNSDGRREGYAWFQSGVLNFGILIDDLGSRFSFRGISAKKMMYVQKFKNTLFIRIVDSICGMRHEKITDKMMADFGRIFGWKAMLINTFIQILLLFPMFQRLVIRRVIILISNFLKNPASFYFQINQFFPELKKEFMAVKIIGEQNANQF